MNAVILKNIGSNWAGMGISILVAFFMMPFVLMKLGVIGYGFWALLQSVVSFTVFLDFGIRSSLIRYLSKAYAENDPLLASQLFNVGLIIYSILGGVIVLLALGLGVYFPLFFEVEGIDQETIFLAVLLVGASVGLYFPSAVLNAVITGHQRYDLMNIAQIIGLLVRTGLAVGFLLQGYGIVGVAIATLCGTLVNLLLDIYFAKQVYPTLAIRISHWDWSIVRILSNHGFFSFIVIGSRGILTNAGIVLVGAFIGPAAVTIYSIGASLTTYASQLVNGISTTLTPAASALDAKGARQELRDLSLNSAKLIMIAGYSILITYLISGDTFISLWLGDEFKAGYAPLRLLSFCWGIFYLQSPFLVILIGLSWHKVPALMMLGQALLSVGLGLALVETEGMLGVAWGAVIASLSTNSISVLYGLKVLGVSFSMYLRKTFFPASLALLPFGLTLAGLSFLYQPTGLFGYFSQVAGAMVVMGLFFPWLGLDAQERRKVFQLCPKALAPYLPQNISINNSRD